MITKRGVKTGIGVVAVVIVAVSLIGFKLYRDKLTVSLPDYAPIKKAVWLDQGWDQNQREKFHHADQGTQTLNIPYEWFIALEQPRLSLVGDVGRLSDPAYLDRYGFIPGATRGGENQLPVGFARAGTMRTATGQPWLNPRTKEPMTRLGFTCAACHTGRLAYRGTTVLVEGGPALTDLGKFRQGLGISVLLTKLSSGRFLSLFSDRFDRFAKNVLGEDASKEDKAELRQQLTAVWDQLDVIRKLDKKVAETSVDEGYGRLDALNRIGNQVFGLSLGPEAREKNYAATTAPVNFPHIWTTPWFDWVQYNASIMQPMVRNAGEAMGVSALINLTDPGKGLFSSEVQVKALANIEKSIAGNQPSETNGFTGLTAPKWPEEILGPIDTALAARGGALYDDLCKGCHLPPVGTKAFWDSKAWLPPNNFNQRYLEIKTKTIADLGTDPAQAEDMRNRKVVIPDSLGIATNEFGPALGQLVEKVVTHWYDAHNVSESERPELNGFRPNLIQHPLAYKMRPLNGVWATPPFIHNGAVPNIYALLSPVSERPKTFYLGRREYDPVCMGYQITASAAPEDNLDLRCLGSKTDPEAGRFSGGFKLDTALRGNRNTGHEFNDGPRANGIIGRKLTPDERRALIEFLKTI
ncbi:di-heme-cytochrome C peroxidase [Nitrobacter vulgaris]|uniref:Cytochrome c domain-containing protein n=1 Tax=Nitrobacter vulgaris TaxID=29421 RepID=A0A1V4I185_NITVU|nr:di-heme-cytochrome C peroxidase [Nitrobacter vulgaris]OPH83998.1 hypothetical protein B2M20_03990 [Nitrobacter vulgaris]